MLPKLGCSLVLSILGLIKLIVGFLREYDVLSVLTLIVLGYKINNAEIDHDSHEEIELWSNDIIPADDDLHVAKRE